MSLALKHRRQTASRVLPWGLPNAFLLGCSFSGTQQRVEMEQMLRDEGWSDLGLECDGRTRVKDVLEQSQGILGQEGFLMDW